MELSVRPVGVTSQIADGIANEIVAVTAGEGEAEAAQAVIRLENAVGCGIIGIFVDGVGTDAFSGRGKAEIDDTNVGDVEISQGVGSPE